MFLNFVHNLKLVYIEISVYVIFSYYQGSTNPQTVLHCFIILFLKHYCQLYIFYSLCYQETFSRT